MTSKINNQVKLFSETKPQYSGFLAQILSAQPRGAGLNSVNFEPRDGVIKISINGQAGVRTDMVTYENNLKSIPQFKNVDLPLSNLTKDTNVTFQITLETDALKYIKIEENE
jgi:hypothetical protein